MEEGEESGENPGPPPGKDIVDAKSADEADRQEVDVKVPADEAGGTAKVEDAKREEAPPSSSSSRGKLRPVRSHPSMMMAAVMPPQPASRLSLRELDGTNRSASRSRSGSRSASLKSSQSTIKGVGAGGAINSVESVAGSVNNGGGGSNHSSGVNLRRHDSPVAGDTATDVGSGGGPDADVECEDEGGHDTITSLAGEKMLSKLNRRGSAGQRARSVPAGSRLEELFRGEESSLEDIRESDDDSEAGAAEERASLIRSQNFLEEEEEDDEEDDDGEFVPPDGGYGWFVALGAFISLFWSAGMIKSYGVLFDRVLEAFPGSSVALASWIPAAMVSCALAVAPITSALCQRYDCRRVTAVGSLLCAAGLCLSAVAPSMPFLFCSLGLLTGVGVGLSTTPGVILTARYFVSNRAKANAFCLSGTAAGSFVLPFLMEALLYEYALRGTVLVLGGCMLHLCISAALYRPMRIHARITSLERQRRAKATASADIKSAAKPASSIYPKDSASTENNSNSNNRQQQQRQQNPGPSPFHADPKALTSRLNSLVEYESTRGSESPNISVISQAGSLPATANKFQWPPSQGRVQLHQQMSLPYHHPHVDCASPSQSHSPCIHLLQQEQQGCSSENSFENLRVLQGVAAASSHSPLPHLNELQYPYPSEHAAVASDSLLAQGQPATQQAKALSMRDITLHQLGSRFNLYRDRFLGSRDGSVTSSSAGMGARKRQQSSTRSSCGSFNFTRKNSCENGNGKKGGNSDSDKARQHPPGRGFSRQSSRHSSLMFSVEDLVTDSTSVIKDAKAARLSRKSERRKRRQMAIDARGTRDQQQPARSQSVLAHNRPRQRHGRNYDRHVSLDRDVTNNKLDKSSSDAARVRAARAGRSKRNRYYSEGHDSDHLEYSSAAASNLFNNKSRFTVIVSKDDLVEEEEEKEEVEVVKDEDGQKKTERSLSEKKKQPGCFQKVFSCLGLGLCREPVFLLLTCSVMCMSLGVPHFLVFLPSHSRTLGADPAVVLSVCSVLDLLGRVGAGAVLDAGVVPLHALFSAAMALSGAAVLAVPAFSAEEEMEKAFAFVETESGPASVLPVATSAGLYGLGTGVWFLMVPLLLSEYLGVERIASSYGLIRFFQSGANLIGPILGGYLWEVSGNLRWTFYLMGAVMLAGSVFPLFIPLALDRTGDPEDKNREREDVEKEEGGGGGGEGDTVKA